MWVEGDTVVLAAGHDRRGVGAGRVLVVAEEELLGGSVATVLTVAGYAVVTARSAREGRWALRAYAFDCLIVDFRLPDVRGDLFYGLARLHQPRLLERTVFLTQDSGDKALLLTTCSRRPVLCAPIEAGGLLTMVDRMVTVTNDELGRVGQ